MARAVTRRTRHPWWLGAMYTVLLVAVLSLLLLLLQDLLTVVESEGGELHHLFVFDLAWPLFLVAGLVSLIAGLVSLLIGLLRADAGLTRYGLLVVAFLLGAILLIVAVDRLQAPAPEHALRNAGRSNASHPHVVEGTCVRPDCLEEPLNPSRS